mmetsp:Transcript_6001/g.14308  ORF Transcript_6001/g.14308 Transcript_6001/m.14308 type:complete len:266 (+) Transcript_6001:374-1171(+)
MHELCWTRHAWTYARGRRRLLSSRSRCRWWSKTCRHSVMASSRSCFLAQFARTHLILTVPSSSCASQRLSRRTLTRVLKHRGSAGLRKPQPVASTCVLRSLASTLPCPRSSNSVWDCMSEIPSPKEVSPVAGQHTQARRRASCCTSSLDQTSGSWAAGEETSSALWTTPGHQTMRSRVPAGRWPPAKASALSEGCVQPASTLSACWADQPGNRDLLGGWPLRARGGGFQQQRIRKVRARACAHRATTRTSAAPPDSAPPPRSPAR